MPCLLMLHHGRQRRVWRWLVTPLRVLARHPWVLLDPRHGMLPRLGRMLLVPVFLLVLLHPGLREARCCRGSQPNRLVLPHRISGTVRRRRVRAFRHGALHRGLRSCRCLPGGLRLVLSCSPDQLGG